MPFIHSNNINYKVISNYVILNNLILKKYFLKKDWSITSDIDKND